MILVAVTPESVADMERTTVQHAMDVAEQRGALADMTADELVQVRAAITQVIREELAGHLSRRLVEHLRESSKG
jgi:hypothetical protein